MCCTKILLHEIVLFVDDQIPKGMKGKSEKVLIYPDENKKKIAFQIVSMT